MTAALTVAEVLERAADLLTPEGAWTQGSFAKDMLGNEYDGYGENGDLREFGGTCFCVFGALALAEDAKDPEMARLGCGTLMKHLGLDYIGQISSWNDEKSRTQAEVVAALRAAAVIAKGGL